MGSFTETRRFAKRRPILSTFCGVVVALLVALGLYTIYVGAPPIMYRGGIAYISMREDAPWLSRSVRLALSTPAPQATPGTLTWRRLTPGLEIGELPVLFGGEEVDRLYLTRIDPKLYRFELRVAPDILAVYPREADG